jgi:hypothetical protein
VAGSFSVEPVQLDDRAASQNLADRAFAVAIALRPNCLFRGRPGSRGRGSHHIDEGGRHAGTTVRARHACRHGCLLAVGSTSAPSGKQDSRVLHAPSGAKYMRFESIGCATSQSIRGGNDQRRSHQTSQTPRQIGEVIRNGMCWGHRQIRRGTKHQFTRSTQGSDATSESPIWGMARAIERDEVALRGCCN